MVYHGTSIKKGNELLKTGIMKPSIGDHHWLGDGCYFYIDSEYAFRWILLEYSKEFSKESSKVYDDIYSSYMIISAELECEEARVFDLSNIKNKLLFLDVKQELEKKAQYSTRFSNARDGIVDGVVINVIFEYMGFYNTYDAVKAVFPIAYIMDDSRQNYLPEPQICVKNICIIRNLNRYDDGNVTEEMRQFIYDYNNCKFRYKPRAKKVRNNIRNKRVTYKYQ